jgi:hypothetical protein
VASAPLIERSVPSEDDHAHATYRSDGVRLGATAFEMAWKGVPFEGLFRLGFFAGLERVDSPLETCDFMLQSRRVATIFCPEQSLSLYLSPLILVCHLCIDPIE